MTPGAQLLVDPQRQRGARRHRDVTHDPRLGGLCGAGAGAGVSAAAAARLHRGLGCGAAPAPASGSPPAAPAAPPRPPAARRQHRLLRRVGLERQLELPLQRLTLEGRRGRECPHPHRSDQKCGQRDRQKERRDQPCSCSSNLDKCAWWLELPDPGGYLDRAPNRAFPSRGATPCHIEVKELQALVPICALPCPHRGAPDGRARQSSRSPRPSDQEAIDALGLRR
jgi:hypothetical protein